MLEYSGLFPVARQELADRGLGPISTQLHGLLGRALRREEQLPLIAYSLGVVLAARLLASSLVDRLRPLVLIAPVVPSSVRKMWSKMHVDNGRVLVLHGTHDSLVGDPCWIRSWSPGAEFMPMEGGNHLYYLLPSPMDRFDENPATRTREDQRQFSADAIIRFLGHPVRKVVPCAVCTIEERCEGSVVHLSDQFKIKAVLAQKLYGCYDQRETGF
jgi:hypothetical protein